MYPKIEISNTLISFGKSSVKPLIKLLGKIGSNQHKTVPDKEFKKDSYPLPRDIAGRTLAHIGKVALSELLKSFETLDLEQKSEAIDTIGFICFYDYQTEAYDILKKCYKQNSESELIKWKIIRAFSGFTESVSLLEMEYKNLLNGRLRKEVDRSLFLIKNDSKRRF